jgi:hypothetical protein
MKKALPRKAAVTQRGDKHQPKRFVGTQVDEPTYRALKEIAKREDRSVSSVLRQILSTGDNHPAR